MSTSNYHAPVHSFRSWRDAARRYLQAGVAPENIRWVDRRSGANQSQQDLFASGEPDFPPQTPPLDTINVPSSFLEIAPTVACHRSAECWSLLYRLLWRLTHGEKHLLMIASDPDVVRLTRFEKAIRRDSHKMKAFVRFRRSVDDLGEHYIAWHRPDHFILRHTAPFFRRRFDVMRWTIMSPDESCHFDGDKLIFGAGMPRSEAPNEDELEPLWKTYYANIFNPARIKLDAMRAEMPKKHWATLPETEMIDSMLREAPRRVDQMIQTTNTISSAQSFVPEHASIEGLRLAASKCQGCSLCQSATQTVFGHGPATASVVLIGEQPGDQEDVTGKPFVGPAGQLLREELMSVGIDPESVYMTNAVKHFKFTRSSKRRLHKKPSAREVAACRPWLEAELKRIKPAQILCLGATAASAIHGPNFRLTQQRGAFISTRFANQTFATYHPSAILRAEQTSAQNETASQIRDLFHRDLKAFASHIKAPPA
ncbi:UdgX family uracil-DNA binding protein [Roseiconus lacunae]|uniref:UdgX family uracil-DNA binding protein n=1 Tax=Roseiconus lacunae TaxID=2605694 RepID=UPI001E4E2D03|nr:UdgX family uracil-DNA binding protein [Roseiconus lacunae]MCD0458365.1 UdgX family uracil-DNA binding protein [Roseiconus lacunae]